MSEDVPEYNTPKKELKFVRLKSTCEDLVGYVTYGHDYLTIETPLRIEIDTIFEEGRQILCLQEYLPQSVIEIKQVDISLNDVMFCTPIKEEFYEQYDYCREFFYENESKLRDAKVSTKRTEQMQELSDNAQKVVSILEAMANKKDKPVH